jgi:hypothetical protein
MKNLHSFQEFIIEKSIGDLDPKREQPMVTGIARIIRRIRDEENRKEIADTQIQEFREEGIEFDYDEFLKLCNCK